MMSIGVRGAAGTCRSSSDPCVLVTTGVVARGGSNDARNSRASVGRVGRCPTAQCTEFHCRVDQHIAAAEDMLRNLGGEILACYFNE